MSCGVDPSKNPIFIIGSPRSGTSILTWCIGQHPNILPLEESNWFVPLALTLQTCYDLGSSRGERSQLSAMEISREQLMGTVGNAVTSLIRDQWRALVKATPALATADLGEPTEDFRLSHSSEDPKQRWVDGTPEYAMDVFGLRKLFPESKFIHILRDVKAVVRSLMHFSKLAGFNLVKTEQEAYEYWRRTVLASVAAERAFGSDVVLRIRYDELTREPEATLHKCLEFVGEAFHAECLTPLQSQINSSKVPPDYDPSDSLTDRELKSQTQQLSMELLGEAPPYYPGSAELLTELESKFLNRARYLTWAGDELARRIAAERKSDAA
jgi:hypothetical protein